MAAADGAQTGEQGGGRAGHCLTFAARAQATVWTRTWGKIADYVKRTTRVLGSPYYTLLMKVHASAL